MSDPNTSSSVSPFYDLMTYEDPPHVIAKKDGSGHEGLLVELVSLVSGKAGFSYSLKVLNESFGHKDSGRWSGLTRKMAEYSADMAVGAMVMSHADDDEVKYTEPFQTTSIQLLLPRPLAEVSPGAALLFVPFTATSWVLLIFAFVLVSLGLFLVGRFSPHEWGRLDPARDVRKARNSFGLKNSFLFVISTLTWQGYREAPRSLSGRVLAVSWWVFTLFILLAYTANLAAFVSSRPQTEPALSFRNFEDILQDRIVKIGMIRHGDVDLTLRMSTENLPKQLYEYVNARRNWVGNLEEGLERMRSSGRDFALMLPATKAQYLAARNCDLVAFGHGLVPISYAFAFSASRLSEPVKRRINSAILQLRQSGELYNLEQKWYSLGSKGCPDTDGNSLPVRRGETPQRFKAMDPQDLAMPFLLLFLCGLVAVGVAALEIMHAMGHFKLQKDEEEAAAEPFNTRAGPSAVDDKAEFEDEEHPLKESPEKEMEDGKPDFEEELEPEEKEKRKEMKLYDDAAIKSDDDGNKAPASDIEKESD